MLLFFYRVFRHLKTAKLLGRWPVVLKEHPLVTEDKQINFKTKKY